jgi:hypothetical protein
VTFVCGSGPGFEWPDVGNDEVPCCVGSTLDGPAGCTCWVEVYDLDQADITPDAPGLRATPCEDCAYRGGSPERQGADHVAGDADALAVIVARNRPFFCHQGMRRPVAYRHPTGVTFTPPGPALTAAYRPPQHAGVPYKTDGTPGDLCAGWAAARLRSDR